MKHLLAQNLQIGGQNFKGPLDPNLNTIGDVVNTVVFNFLIPISAVILLFVFIWGGYDFLLSQGSPDKIKSGRAKIVTGLIGFVLILMAFTFAKLGAYIFGLGNGVLGN